MSAPVDKITVGNVTVSVFENTIKKGKDTFTTKSVTIQKNYKDGDKWKSTGSFKPSELPFVLLAVQELLRKLYLREQIDDVTFDDTQS